MVSKLQSLSVQYTNCTEGWLEIDKHYSLELCFSIEKQPEAINFFLKLALLIEATRAVRNGQTDTPELSTDLLVKLGSVAGRLYRGSPGPTEGLLVQ